MAKYRVYDNGDDSVCIADQAGWLPGVYRDQKVAVYAVSNLSEDAIKRWLEPIYSTFGEDRPVTTQDVDRAWDQEKADPTPSFVPTGLSAVEKLAKIEELLHPGFWSAYDYRRDAILKVLGSTRPSWHSEPEEYRGR